jgi:FkbM family methyltransferase
MRRRVEGSFVVNGRQVAFSEWAAFLGAYAEIFCNEIYRFRHDSLSPIIIDVGANVGLATLWWKTMYPGSKITAIEADPQIFELLRRNVIGAGIDNVELIGAAAWVKNGDVRFSPDHSDGGRVSGVGTLIRSICLFDLLDKYERIDFLKIDIEGGERILLPHIEKALVKVNTMFCEYHSCIGQPQGLEEILGVISRSGFRYHIKNLLASRHPFVKIEESCGFDNQINIFCYR